ncbi:MAG TPA: type II toxin-antitoxin system VapC family toxin [Stellaceae bacterium]|nr:type II toxin-antitoxin system VapC family toxin [Stellaceae bacterium]
MKILLDTHIFLWWNGHASLILPPLRRAIAEPDNEIYVSAASIWEIGIKRASGKLAVSGGIVAAIRDHGFQLLPITGEHAEHAGALPRHHNDPFDRMLVAQAEIERFVLGTQDPKVGTYGVAVLGLGGG